MLLRTSLIALISLSLLSCRGAPVEPEAHICELKLVLIDDKIDMANSVVHCVSDLDPHNSQKEAYYQIAPYLLSKPVLMSIQDYGNKASWGVSLREWSKANCK